MKKVVGLLILLVAAVMVVDLEARQAPSTPKPAPATAAALDKPSKLTLGEELELRRELADALGKLDQAKLDLNSLDVLLQAERKAKEAAVGELAGAITQRDGQGVMSENKARWDALEQTVVKALGGDHEKGDRLKRDDKGLFVKPFELVKKDAKE